VQTVASKQTILKILLSLFIYFVFMMMTTIYLNYSATKVAVATGSVPLYSLSKSGGIKGIL
jgi:hypothetical protein